MKITSYHSTKPTKKFQETKCSTPKKVSSCRRQSVIEAAKLKIPVTSENDEFDLWDHNRGLGKNRKPRTCWSPVLILTVIVMLVMISLFLPNGALTAFKDKIFGHQVNEVEPNICLSSCNIELVESIPEGLVYPDKSPLFQSTYKAWNRLIGLANKTINIGSFYWTLRGADFYNHSSAWQGESIFQNLLLAGTKTGIKIRIAQSQPSNVSPNLDTEILIKQKAAEVRSLDFPKLVGGGVLHTKLWIVDGKHMYVGSANMDWRSLTQVKELGVLITDCSCLVDDVSKIFNVYWDMGKKNAKIPQNWPIEYSTKINASNPVPVDFNNQYKMNTFFSSSPPPMSPDGRSQDIDAIVNVIQNAEQFIHISVMDYLPMFEYTARPKFWPIIDDALRAAAIERRVSVKLLISWWKHSRPAQDFFLNSLKVISNSYRGVDIQVRRFICPATDDQSQIPFGRVNHNKYMVTDNTAYIGTSNWSADYFVDTAGIGLVMEERSDRNETVQSIRRDLASVFERDWNSAYAVELKIPPTD
ncbi:phospholipase D3-like isoform X2 [Contarinia nasturtii]|uniref:phospholipase D3-like isoform X2 n=1 Tax=Contarinia nasturtii TaxID=265458 RepID=UPI0012D3A17D|nr:phospholipase D3-like isoform X2 [Contarinia nasturtii]